MMVMEDPEGPEELWLSLFDNVMSGLVSYKADYLASMTPEKLRDTILQLVGTVIEAITVRKTSWGPQSTYTARSVSKKSDDDDE